MKKRKKGKEKEKEKERVKILESGLGSRILPAPRSRHRPCVEGDTLGFLRFCARQPDMGDCEILSSTQKPTHTLLLSTYTNTIAERGQCVIMTTGSGILGPHIHHTLLPAYLTTISIYSMSTLISGKQL